VRLPIVTLRQIVTLIREQTHCARCGAQPIDWHRFGHVNEPELRLGRWHGSDDLTVLLAEIEVCTPLCRRHHMATDGRAEDWHQHSPRHQRIEGLCAECQYEDHPLFARGLCRRCYYRFHHLVRTGRLSWLRGTSRDD